MLLLSRRPCYNLVSVGAGRVAYVEVCVGNEIRGKGYRRLLWLRQARR